MQVLKLVLLVIIQLQQPLLPLLLKLLRLLQQLDECSVCYEQQLLLQQQITHSIAVKTAIITKTIARIREGYELALHIVCQHTQDHRQGYWVPVIRRTNERHSACPIRW